MVDKDKRIKFIVASCLLSTVVGCLPLNKFEIPEPKIEPEIEITPTGNELYSFIWAPDGSLLWLQDNYNLNQFVIWSDGERRVKCECCAEAIADLQQLKKDWHAKLRKTYQSKGLK